MEFYIYDLVVFHDSEPGISEVEEELGEMDSPAI